MPRLTSFMQPTTLKEKIFLIIFGIALSLVLIEISMRAAGFALLFLREHRNNVSLRDKGEFRILCLGESTTALGGATSYPAQLEELLNGMRPGIKVSVINAGKEGVDSSFVVANLKHNLDKYSPDAVIAMIGINDNNKDLIISSCRRPRVMNGDLFDESRVYKLMALLGARIKRAFFPSENRRVQESIFNQVLFFPLCLESKDGLPDGLEKKASSSYEQFKEFKKCFAAQPKGADPEERFKNVIHALPDNVWAYTGAGRYYWLAGDRREAEYFFEKAVEKRQNNEWVYFAIAACYVTSGDFDKGILNFQRAVQANPGNSLGYMGLGWCYGTKGDDRNAEAMLNKALTLEPDNINAYCFLASVYRHKKMYWKAGEVLKKAMALSPSKELPYVKLSYCYWEQGDYEKAKEVAQKGAAACPSSAILLDILARLYRDHGDPKAASDYALKADDLRSHNCNAATKYNYWQIQEMLAARKIRLICMQYPLRSIESLKQMFDSPGDIIFVDNKRIFEEALKKKKYSDYFTDIFAGDFGHCTPEGNRLLAENAAKAIVGACLK